MQGRHDVCSDWAVSRPGKQQELSILVREASELLSGWHAGRSEVCNTPWNVKPWLEVTPGGLGAVNGLQVVQEPVVLCGACGVVDVGGQEDVVGHANVHLQACALG